MSTLNASTNEKKNALIGTTMKMKTSLPQIKMISKATSRDFEDNSGGRRLRSKQCWPKKEIVAKKTKGEEDFFVGKLKVKVDFYYNVTYPSLCVICRLINAIH